MKKILAFVLAGVLALALFACDSNPPDPPENNTTNPTQVTSGASGDVIEDIYFEASGVRIEMGALPAPVLEALGDPETEPFESQSCALNAKDINYKYPGFVLTVTYPEKGDEYITGVKFSDDGCKTPGGITIGSTFEALTAAYGTDYEEKTGFFTYKQGLSSLEFSIKDGKVNQIIYAYDFINA